MAFARFEISFSSPQTDDQEVALYKVWQSIQMVAQAGLSEFLADYVLERDVQLRPITVETADRSVWRRGSPQDREQITTHCQQNRLSTETL